MTAPDDPYRTLGLARGASADEIRRAYRALAKVNHPDAAGPSALPRFLAIQAAYEQLRSAGAGRKGGRPGPTTGGRPSAADPDRADAAQRAYGGRARRGRAPDPDPAASGGGPAGAPKGRPRARPESARPGPSARPRAKPREAGGSGDPAEDDPTQPKATLGSTSYDGADTLPFEPDWGGASWYGTTSGTYWTINPKEYADPRKHGPEYQARARRSTRRRGAQDPLEPADPSPTEDEVGGSSDPSRATSGPRSTGTRPHGRPSTATPPPPDEATAGAAPRTDPTHTTASWWSSTAAADPDPTTAPPPPRPTRPSPRSSAAVDPPPPDLAAAATDLGRALTDERTGRGRWRAVQAVVAWLPILFGIAWLVGEVTGCGRFAASCSAGEPVVAPVIGLLVLGVLLLSPWLSAVAATGSVALILVAVPTALLLSAGGTAIDVQSRSDTLGLALVLAWLAGIGFAVVRRVRSMASRARPVS